MLNDLKKLIAVQSVMGEPEEGAPFGVGPRAALDCFLNMAAAYGMKTKNENGYCGWAEIGAGETCIGILGHLDVVPAGSGWGNDPFSLVSRDGLLFGRGVADDKGPTVAALHALKNLKESGKKLRHRIRLIVGCNEENGSECIEYYRKHCEIPIASFVPDADFPVINSEKGILHLSVQLPADKILQTNVTELRAGLRPNIVPDLCTAVVPEGCALYNRIASFGANNDVFKTPEVATVIVNNAMRIEDFSVHFFEDKLTLEARGVAGHAMAPDKGENAALKMLMLLNGLLDRKSSALHSAVKYLGAPNPADLLGIAEQDEVSGNLTVNTGIVHYTASETVTITLDLRLPVCADHEKVIAQIGRCFSDACVSVDRWSPNLYVPADGKLVTALLDAYHETTGGKKECLYCGGGTYARELPNAVAFGPTFPALETNIHNIDESFPLELFFKLPAIYEAAVLKLDEAFADA